VPTRKAKLDFKIVIARTIMTHQKLGIVCNQAADLRNVQLSRCAKVHDCHKGREMCSLYERALRTKFGF